MPELRRQGSLVRPTSNANPKNSQLLRARYEDVMVTERSAGSFCLLVQFVPVQLAVAVGIEFFESLSQCGDIATLWISNEFLQRDRSVTVPVSVLEELVLPATL